MINKNNNGPKVYTRTYKSVHENNQDNNYKKPNYNTNNSPLPVNKVNNIRVYVEKNDKYKLPAKASIGSVGYDLFSTEDMVIPSGKAVLVPTGLKMAIPRGYEMQIRSRSGLCLNHSIMVMNSPATIDPDYRGEIQVILYNFANESFAITKGDRIAQAVFSPVIFVKFMEVDELHSTGRGDKGFGSSGLHGDTTYKMESKYPESKDEEEANEPLSECNL